MTKDISRVGYWSGLAAFTSTVAYDVAQILQVAGLLRFPADEILIYGTSLCIVVPFILEMAALHHLTAPDKRFWTQAALIFTIIYAVFVSANYVVQLATVIPAKLSGTSEAIRVLDQAPHSLLWDYDAVGYIAMGLACLLAVPAVNTVGFERWVKTAVSRIPLGDQRPSVHADAGDHAAETAEHQRTPVMMEQVRTLRLLCRKASWLVVALLLTAACGMSHDYKEEDRVSSPSGEALAVVYSDMGGGAAGWCYLKVTVLSKDAPVDFAQIDGNGKDAFSSNCDSDIKLKWLSDTELSIQYTIGEHGASTHQRRTGLDGRVRIVYLPKS